MTKQLESALSKQKKQTKREVLQIAGSLGIPIGGSRKVEVPGRNGYVYVRLRDNANEVIQAFNNKVSPAYNLPVIVERQGGRYVVVSVDTLRYQNNWNSFAPFLPRHGATHAFGSGDPVWVDTQQFMPMLVIPSGTDGGPNVVVSSYILQRANGTWLNISDQGTSSFAPYLPTGSSAVMGLVYMDAGTGYAGFVINSGSHFSNSVTGSSAIVPYLPVLSNPNYIPLAGIRLVSGTTSIKWDNIYDTRQFLHTQPTGTGGSSPAASQYFAIASSDYTETTISGATPAPLYFNTELVDDNDIVSLAGDNLSLIFNQAGWYSVNLVIQYAVNGGSAASGDGVFNIEINNTGAFDNAFLDVYVKAGEIHNYNNVFMNCSVDMEINDEISVEVSKTSGDDVNALIQEIRIQKL